MSVVSPEVEIETLWRESSARLRAWFERETGSPSDAEDLLQETFLRVHERLDTLVETTSVRAWIGRIARNALIDHLRRRRLPVVDVAAEDPAHSELEPLLDRTVAGWLEDFLAELEPEDAAALRLVDLEGRTQVELAAQTGLSLSGAKSRVQRARSRLRARLEACCAFAFDAHGGILEAKKRAGARRCEPRARDGECEAGDCPEEG